MWRKIYGFNRRFSNNPQFLGIDDDPALRQMMTEYFVNPDHSALGHGHSGFDRVVFD
jgi:hypothetical protein